MLKIRSYGAVVMQYTILSPSHDLTFVLLWRYPEKHVPNYSTLNSIKHPDIKISQNFVLSSKRNLCLFYLFNSIGTRRVIKVPWKRIFESLERGEGCENLVYSKGRNPRIVFFLFLFFNSCFLTLL